MGVSWRKDSTRRDDCSCGKAELREEREHLEFLDQARKPAKYARLTVNTDGSRALPAAKGSLFVAVPFAASLPSARNARGC